MKKLSVKKDRALTKSLIERQNAAPRPAPKNEPKRETTTALAKKVSRSFKPAKVFVPYVRPADAPASNNF